MQKRRLECSSCGKVNCNIETIGVTSKCSSVTAFLHVSRPESKAGPAKVRAQGIYVLAKITVTTGTFVVPHRVKVVKSQKNCCNNWNNVAAHGDRIKNGQKLL